MSEAPHCGFVNPLECRELLVRIDERVGQMHKHIYGGNGTLGLEERVTSLEKTRSESVGRTKLLAAIGGGGGLIGVLTALWRWLMHGH